MVRARVARRGQLGKLTVGHARYEVVADALKDDPDIRAAAIAGLNGHGDFMALLRLPPAEWEIAIAVLNVQEAERVKRVKDEMQALASMLRG